MMVTIFDWLMLIFILIGVITGKWWVFLVNIALIVILLIGDAVVRGKEE